MPTTNANPLTMALTAGGAPQSGVGGSSALPHKTLGQKVTAVGLIAPTLLNWLVLAHARWIAMTEIEDSEGVAHAIHYYRSMDFENNFFVASIACMSGLFAHLWLTAGAIALRHALDQAGARGGVGYAARLAAAEAEAKTLSRAEWAHVALVGLDFFFAAFFVFISATGWVGAACIGLGVPAGVALIAWKVLGPARAAVLSKQRTTSVAFAGGALRGSLATLLVQAVLVARFAAFVLNFPVEPFKRDCEWQDNMDATTNDTWPFVAPISNCSPDLFVDGVVPDSKAMFYYNYAPRIIQSSGSILITYYLLIACFLYYAARGQGILHDKLFTELDMTKTHCVALLLWLLATFGAICSLAVMWAGWTDQTVMGGFIATCHLCAAVGLLGMMAVLWKEQLLLALGIGDASTAAAKSARHVVFASMRFANGQPLPEAIELREALKDRGVHLKIVELTAGADINQEVFESIEHAEAFMVFGTSNYGEKTPNPACTYFESEYARNAGKKMILLRMIPWDQQFDHLQARVIFGMNSLVLSWMEEMPMPGDLVESIVAALEGDAPAPTPAPEGEGLATPALAVAVAPTRPSQDKDADIKDTVRRIIADPELVAALKQALLA